jgi:hypothetical protein
MEFQCLFCPLPLEPVNVHRETSKHKRRPHFRPYKNKKAEHRHPCEFAGKNPKGATRTGEFEVPYDEMEIPTKLVKMERRFSGGVAATSNPYRLALDDGNTPNIRHEEYTCHALEELCDVYFEKIKNHKKLADQKRALQGLRLILPHLTEDFGYVNAFHFVNLRSLPMDYRIFYGAVKCVMKCRDGYIISYTIPGYYNEAWTPVVAFLPQVVLNEFAWGRFSARKLVQDNMNKTPWLFLYGYPKLDSQGIVILLENAYWVRCAEHPCWYNPWPTYVSEESKPYSEVLPKLFASQRDEFQEKFPQAERTHPNNINIAQLQPEQKSLIAQPDLSPPSLAGIISPSVLPDASPEQVSSPNDMPTRSPLPERETAKHDTDESWWKKIRRWRPWRWKTS